MDKYIKQLYEAFNKNTHRAKTALAIESAADTSAILNCGNKSLVGILMPADLTSATFDIEGSIDGSNFYPITNNYGSGLSTITFAADTLYSIDPALTLPWQYIRIVTVGNEGAERSFEAITRFIS